MILGVEATRARRRQETLAARRMLQQVQERLGIRPESLGADKGYGSGKFMDWLVQRQIQPHIPVIDRRPQGSWHYTLAAFHYNPSEDAYRCPQGQVLRYHGENRAAQGHIYRTTESQCRDCPVKKRCTRAPKRKIVVHWYEAARQKTRELAHTPEYARSRRERNKIEALFSELKLRRGLGRARLRRLWNVSEQFYLAATAQNLRRLVRFLELPQPSPAGCSI